jgi:hypothetical protein
LEGYRKFEYDVSKLFADHELNKHDHKLIIVLPKTHLENESSNYFDKPVFLIFLFWQI